MEKAMVIIFIGLLVFLAHAFVALFQKTKIPDVLYLIIIGLVIGPILNIVDPKDFGKVGSVFTTIALVVILFEGGMEISFENIGKSIKGTLLLTSIGYLLAFIFVSAFLFVTGILPIMQSIYMGAVLAGPAPAVVIPLVKHLKMSDKIRTMLTLEAALGEAVCIVISLAILQVFLQPEFQIGKLVGSIISSFLFAVLIGVFGGYFWSIILNKIRNLRNAIFTTPSFVFILYGACELLGFSGPVFALTFGIVIGNIGYGKIQSWSSKLKLTPIHHNEIEKMFFSEIVFLLKTFLFVFLGISIVINDFWILLSALQLIFALAISRFLMVKITVDKTITAPREGSFISAMISKGLATIVLASIPLQYGLQYGENIQSIVNSVVLFSIIFTSLFIFVFEKTNLPDKLKWIFGNSTT